MPLKCLLSLSIASYTQLSQGLPPELRRRDEAAFPWRWISSREERECAQKPIQLSRPILHIAKARPSSFPVPVTRTGYWGIKVATLPREGVNWGWKWYWQFIIWIWIKIDGCWFSAVNSQGCLPVAQQVSVGVHQTTQKIALKGTLSLPHCWLTSPRLWPCRWKPYP